MLHNNSRNQIHDLKWEFDDLGFAINYDNFHETVFECPSYAVIAVLLSLLLLLCLFSIVSFHNIFAAFIFNAIVIFIWYFICTDIATLCVFCFRFICSWVIWYSRTSVRLYFPSCLKLLWSISNDIFFARRTFKAVLPEHRSRDPQSQIRAPCAWCISYFRKTNCFSHNCNLFDLDVLWSILIGCFSLLRFYVIVTCYEYFMY